jgi:hypothetical protein
MISLPTLLLPLVLWQFIYSLTGKNRLADWAGAIGSAFLLLDSGFVFTLPAGLDFFSTFQIGLYTQPLGFVFLLLWYLSFQRITSSGWRFSLSTVFLALRVLSNFFAGITAALFALIVILHDVFDLRYSRGSFAEKQDNPLPAERQKTSARSRLTAHIISVFLAFSFYLRLGDYGSSWR